VSLLNLSGHNQLRKRRWLGQHILRQEAAPENPVREHLYGQDILGVSDLYRRSASQHDYIKAIIQ